VPNFLKRIILFWHEKLFREISFSLLQKIRSVDIIHREEENKKKKKEKKMYDLQKAVAEKARAMKALEYAQNELDICEAQLESVLKEVKKNWIEAERKWASSVLSLVEARKTDSAEALVRSVGIPRVMSQSVKDWQQEVIETRNNVAREHNAYLMACECAGFVREGKINEGTGLAVLS
jgi:vacuolar-type H+-ATPase subunit I/STV1